MTTSRSARPNTVKTALTPNRRNRARVENDDYAAFARRIVAAHGRRIAAGDVERLRDLVALAEEVDHATTVAVDRTAPRRLLLDRDRHPTRHHPPSRPTTMGQHRRRVASEYSSEVQQRAR